MLAVRVPKGSLICEIFPEFYYLRSYAQAKGSLTGLIKYVEDEEFIEFILL